MREYSAQCQHCKAESFALWINRPPEKAEAICHKCWDQLRATGKASEFTWDVVLGRPLETKGIYRCDPRITFEIVASFIDACLDGKTPIEADLKCQHHATLAKLLFTANDLILDATWIPHWKSQISQINAHIAQLKPQDAPLTECENRIEFLQERIEAARSASANRTAAQQRAVHCRLREHLGAWHRGEPYIPYEIPILEVNWELLSPDGDWLGEASRHFRQLGLGACKIDMKRFQFLAQFKPDCIFVGLGNFRGYLAFMFSSRRLAILESAVIGNAAFMMDSSEWRDLSKLSKTALLETDRSDVSRIIHSGNVWRTQILKRLTSREVSIE